MNRTSLTIGGVEVRPGAVIKGPITTDRMFGRLIQTGARCDSLEPESWTPIVCADSTVIWEGDKEMAYDRANAAARAHARRRIDEHLHSIFA